MWILKRINHRILTPIACGAFLATVLGFAGQVWWGFELLDHPRPQYCLILGLAIAIGIVSRQWLSLIWVIPIVLNLVLMLPLFFVPNQEMLSPGVNAESSPGLQILHANLDRHNPNIDRAIAYLSHQSADIIFLQEVTSQWLTQLNEKLSGYQMVVSEPLNNTQGVAMFVWSHSTTMTILNADIIHLPKNSTRPTIAATIRVSGKNIALLSLHTTRPRNRNTSAYQQREFSAAAQWSQTQLDAGRDAIAIGDFNTTPWSGRFRRFLRESDLQNSLQGYGLQPTWLAGFPSIFMIPIDHCATFNLVKTLKYD